MKYFTLILVLFLSISCNSSTPSNSIINYAKKKYGTNFQEGTVDISKIFNFQWNQLYIFPPLTYPEDIKNATGLDYNEGVVPDDNYLFMFVYKGRIEKKYIYSHIKIGFSDNHNGMYLIKKSDALYNMRKLGSDNYWLYKINK